MIKGKKGIYDDARDKALAEGPEYKSRFALPVAEADFVCALAQIMGCLPDEALKAIIRHWAKDNHDVALDSWHRAFSDGRGPW